MRHINVHPGLCTRLFQEKKTAAFEVREGCACDALIYSLVASRNGSVAINMAPRMLPLSSQGSRRRLIMRLLVRNLSSMWAGMPLGCSIVASCSQ